MKKLFIPFVALFLSFSLGSCDKAKELADVDIPLEVTSDEIPLSTVGSPGKMEIDYSFDKTVEVDLFQGELKQYKDYLDKIRGFHVTKLIITIVKVEKGVNIEFLDPTFAVLKDDKDKVEMVLSGKKIEEGAVFEVSGTILKKIDTILNKKKKFKYQIVGGFNNEANITIKIEVAGKVTVNPFK